MSKFPYLADVPDDGGDEKMKELVVQVKVVQTQSTPSKENSGIRLDGGSSDRDRVRTFLEDKRLAEGYGLRRKP